MINRWKYISSSEKRMAWTKSVFSNPVPAANASVIRPIEGWLFRISSRRRAINPFSMYTCFSGSGKTRLWAV